MKSLLLLIAIVVTVVACSQNEIAATPLAEPAATATTSSAATTSTGPVAVPTTGATVATGVEAIPGVAQRPSADERMHMDIAFERFQVALAESFASPPVAQPEELETMRKIRDRAAALQLKDGCLASVNKIRVVVMTKAINSLKAYLDGNETGSNEAMREVGEAIVKADAALARCPT